MMLIIYMITSALVGFGMHRFYKPTEIFGKRWATLIRYGLGELALMPLRSIFRDALRRSQARGEITEEICVSADVLADVSMGVGVLAGHIFDRVEGDDQ